MVRVLLLADTHLGFDFVLRPRVERPRRGPDFFDNTLKALAPARAGEVDLVVHGGDLLNRSRPPIALVRQALEPLLEVADLGIPVVLILGNHERSAIPYPLLAAHRHLHVFDQPQSINLELAGQRVVVAGFANVRHHIRDQFRDLVVACNSASRKADIRLLCLHQTVEGARVGPSDYCFRSGPDVIRGRDLPTGYAAVLAGHIHRHQVLERDLAGRSLPVPVFYPGSVERTSFAERDEVKGYMTFDLEGGDGGRVVNSTFHALPSRAMVMLTIDVSGRRDTELDVELTAYLNRQSADAVIRIVVNGQVEPGVAAVFRAANLRRMAQPNQVVEVRFPRRK